MDTGINNTISKIAFIGNYAPRQCGIATFTTDLCESISTAFPDIECVVVAMDDIEGGYDYPERVRFHINENDLDSYRNAADFLNLNNFDLVCLQHEFGIFGGSAGGHILTLLRQLNMPIVTTFHTILHDPDPFQNQVMKEIARLSSRVIAMTNRSSDYLVNIYGIPRGKIDLIPHGIPDVPFVDPNFYKDKFAVEGKQVLLTFGLLSPNKGIENVIKALPMIARKFPDFVYMVLGATHPNVRRTDGEKYRKSLIELARNLGVEDKVIFHDRFVDIGELIEFIGAADIYITPYLNPAQIVSGTLAYSVGAGKAVISTPYWHAEELLDDGRGVLVPFNDPAAISREVICLLENEAERHAMRKKAYLLGREMVWNKVAGLYMESFVQSRERRLISKRITSFVHSNNIENKIEHFELNLKHLMLLTDDTGILQHSIYSIPNYQEGYTTDDNARALLVSLMLDELGEQTAINPQALSHRYLAFLSYAYNPKNNRFRNFLSYDRTWLEEQGSDDSHGRALWSLGYLLGHSIVEGLRGVASRIFNSALPSVLELKSPRAWAYTLIGIAEYLQRYPGDRTVTHIGDALAQRLAAMYQSTSDNDWKWFEPIVAYDNAILSLALLSTDQWLQKEDIIEIGLESLKWLVSVQTAVNGNFSPIGSNGFYPRNGTRARFDQQPIEANATVSACLKAFRITEDMQWYEEALRAFNWFLGHNDIEQPLYDIETGGCRDGLHSDRTNQNEGAESLLSFLMALLQLRLFRFDVTAHMNQSDISLYPLVKVDNHGSTGI
jgi:glycosyltransferase involved in cell wall biosynthesis